MCMLLLFNLRALIKLLNRQSLFLIKLLDIGRWVAFETVSSCIDGLLEILQLLLNILVHLERLRLLNRGGHCTLDVSSLISVVKGGSRVIKRLIGNSCCCVSFLRKGKDLINVLGERWYQELLFSSLHLHYDRLIRLSSQGNLKPGRSCFGEALRALGHRRLMIEDVVHISSDGRAICDFYVIVKTHAQGDIRANTYRDIEPLLMGWLSHRLIQRWRGAAGNINCNFGLCLLNRSRRWCLILLLLNNGGESHFDKFGVNAVVLIVLGFFNYLFLLMKGI